MSLRICVSLCLVGASALAAPDNVPTSQRDQAARMVGAILVGGEAFKTLEELSDRVGARVTTTPEYERAVKWAADRLRAAGIKEVRLEPFTMEHGWRRGAGRGRMLSPVERPLHLESAGWSLPTPAGGIRGELAVVKDVTPAALDAQAESLRGKIVILDRPPPGKRRPYKQILMFLRSFERFKKAGAVAILFAAPPESTAYNVVHTGNVSWGGKLSQLPTAFLGLEDSRMLLRHLERGPVRVEVEFQNKTTGPVKVNSVVGELRGTERPDEWILLGAHLDSWDLGTGSQDDGAGVAHVLEAARVLAAAGPFKRSIRFALWGGEEQGLVGSSAYVRAHDAELGKCVAVLNSDNGSGHPRGWKVQGRHDVEKALRPIAKTLLVGLGADTVDDTLTYDTDHGPFLVEGVPAIDLLVDRSHYDEFIHRNSDTIDKVVEHELAEGAAVMAVTAYALADSVQPFAPRLDRAEVTELVKEESLDEFLRFIGIWK